MKTSTHNTGSNIQIGVITTYIGRFTFVYSSLMQIIIWAAIFNPIAAIYQTFLLIVPRNLSIPFLQWETIWNSTYIRSMLSYTHMGMNTINQFQCVLDSSLRHNSIRNTRNMNHVNSALCNIAISLIQKLNVRGYVWNCKLLIKCFIKS